MKIIVTGATGLVGEGVILSCIDNPKVDKILMVNRRHFNLTHPKLEEYIISDFINDAYDPKVLSGYDACFFCAGKSSLGMTEEAYTHLTYTTTIAFAEKLKTINPSIAFNFISGAWTDSTEKGKVMWARVKGRTENALLKMGFTKTYMFRPGFLKPYKGQKNIRSYYKVVSFLMPLMLILFPSGGSTIEQLAKAMVNTIDRGYDTTILEVADIKKAAK